MTATFDEQQYHLRRGGHAHRIARLTELHRLLAAVLREAPNGPGRGESLWIRCVHYINTDEQDRRERAATRTMTPIKAQRSNKISGYTFFTKSNKENFRTEFDSRRHRLCLLQRRPTLVSFISEKWKSLSEEEKGEWNKKAVEANEAVTRKWEGWMPWNVELALHDASRAVSLLAPAGAVGGPARSYPGVARARELQRWAKHVTMARTIAKRPMRKKERAAAKSAFGPLVPPPTATNSHATALGRRVGAHDGVRRRQPRQWRWRWRWWWWWLITIQAHVRGYLVRKIYE